MTAFVRTTSGGVIRQGITLGGIDVVVVAASRADVDYVRTITQEAVAQHGLHLLTLEGHPPVEGDQPVAAPVLDETGRLVGYVELAP